MDGSNEQQSAEQPPVDAMLIESGVSFLRALFDTHETILFRPIEIWNEGGKKQRRLLYDGIRYSSGHPLSIADNLRHLHRVSIAGNANVFFGVCPRRGNKGRFDLAWQIRKVRAIWTDIDHVTVDDALAGIAKSGLPPPSITVNSGNGVHFYWLLNEPYLIDDVGNPPAVETEWIETHGGRKKPQKYIIENGDRIYLDQRRHALRLSGKAEHAQDVLAGVAKACGGDHTTDLARLLRVPGTFNRKDQRNGREPILTKLVELDQTRRYSFAEFERFASLSPETERVKKIAAMPLPKARTPSPAKSDKLAELVAACAIAPAGSRSESDFSLCCFAIRNGIDKEQVWGSVEKVGKFAEQGRRYFDVTWGNAEFEERSGTYEKLLRKHQLKRTAKPLPDNTAMETKGRDPADMDDELDDDFPRTIHIDRSLMPVCDTLRRITDHLIEAKNCFIRCDQLVVIRSDLIKSILSAHELAGLLNELVEFFYTDENGGEYRPLTSDFASTWLNKKIEHSRIPKITLFTRNPVFTEDWRMVVPGFDPQSGIYYTGKFVEPRNGTPYLDALLQDFCFKSDADRTNYIAVLLTAVLIPRFIGSKPAVLFNGNQPGLGKSILAQIIAILRDGRPTDTVSYNPNDEEFEKRLAAIVRRGTTTIIIDNAKGQGRKARIDSACLERSVTDQTLSYRLLGKSEEIRAENSHIFCITANTPDVSPDLVSRSVVINLQHEGDPKRRTFHVDDPEAYAEQHRWELLGELLGMVQRWLDSGSPKASVKTRFNKRGWGHIVGGVLEANGLSGLLANAEVAAVELDETRREFTELVEVLADHPQGIWTAADLVALCQNKGLLANDLGDGSAKSLSTKMGVLSGRYIDEQFDISDSRRVAFRRDEGRKGKLYRVAILDQVTNHEGGAEPLPNLDDPVGLAPEFV